MSPLNVDISEIKDIISDIETFLYPTKGSKKDRPHISYKIEHGSAKHKFFLPITAVILFNGLIQEINSRSNIDFLDYKRQAIISKFQKKAKSKGLTIELNNSLSDNSSLIIDEKSDYELTAPSYFESEFYIYGEVYQEGGKTPNVHISTKEFGNLTISATKEQIMDGEKKTYKLYGLKVKGKKNIEDGKLYDLELLEYIQYKPIFNRNLLNKIIDKASVNLNKISNVDNWINNLRAEGQ